MYGDVPPNKSFFILKPRKTLLYICKGVSEINLTLPAYQVPDFTPEPLRAKYLDWLKQRCAPALINAPAVNVALPYSPLPAPAIPLFKTVEIVSRFETWNVPIQ